MAPVAVGVAAVLVAVGSAPASADQVRHSEWWLTKLRVTAAQQTSLGSGVTIAVLSTGSDTTAADIAGSVSAGPDFSRSSRSQGGPFYGILGTEIDSIIVGHGHGPGHAQGILGVAPAAKIISIRVGLDSGDPELSSSSITAGLPDAIAQGIRAAVQTGASVIDLPLDPAAGTATGGTGVTGLTDPSPAEKSAIAFAISKGAVLVAPAGDDAAAADHGVVNYPAAFPGVISVGAFNSNLVKPPFSSRQPYVTLTAAGVGVPVESPTGYTTLNSTAAAAAVVAGIAALIRSAFPALTPQQVTAALTSSTRFHHSGGGTSGSGHGVVDASAALAAATATAEPHGKAAGAGSVPRVAPVVPAVASPRSTLSHKIKQDAMLSGAVLLGLLLLVGLFAVIRRFRRDPYDGAGGPPDVADRPAMAGAGAGRGGPTEYLPAPGTRMETVAPGSHGYEPSAFEPQPFATQAFGSPSFAASGPGGPGSPGGPGGPFDGQGDLNGHRSFNGASAGGGAPGGAGGAPFGAASAPFGAVPGGGKHSADLPNRPRPGIGPRPVTTRAKVTGAPPWEPAAKPDSELPWAAGPSPGGQAAAAPPQAPSAASAQGGRAQPAQPQFTASQFTAQPQYPGQSHQGQSHQGPPQQGPPQAGQFQADQFQPGQSQPGQPQPDQPQDPAPPQYLTAPPQQGPPPPFTAQPQHPAPSPFTAQPQQPTASPFTAPPQFNGQSQPSAPSPFNGQSQPSAPSPFNGQPQYPSPFTAQPQQPAASPFTAPPQYSAQPQYSAAADSVWGTNTGSTDAIWDTAAPQARDANGRREFTGAQDISPNHGGPRQQAWGQPDAVERAESTETFPAYPADDD